MTELEHKRLIAKNTAALYVRMLVRLAITLYTSRIVLDILGVDDFALYGIVGGIVTLLTFLQTALNASTQRFMSIELGRGDTAALKRVFDGSMTLYLLVALVIVILAETAGLWFLNTRLVIPPDRLNAVNWVFQFSILVTCVNIIQTPYNASIIAHEKMSFYAWISIADVVLKLGVVFVLMLSPVDKLVSYAALLFAVSLVIFFITRGYALHQFNVCRFKPSWDKQLLKKWPPFRAGRYAIPEPSWLSHKGVYFAQHIHTAGDQCRYEHSHPGQHSHIQFRLLLPVLIQPQITKASAQGNQGYLQDLVNQTSNSPIT